jgi:hypothetical protein
VCHGAGPAEGDAICFGEDVVNVDVDVSVGVVEGTVDSFEARRADEDGVGLGEAVRLSLRVKEFVDGRFLP